MEKQGFKYRYGSLSEKEEEIPLSAFHGRGRRQKRCDSDTGKIKLCFFRFHVLFISRCCDFLRKVRDFLVGDW